MKKKIQTGIHRLLIRSTSLLSLIFAVISADAADIGADFSAGVGFSDNILRTELDHVETFTGLLGVRFDLDQSSARIDANIRSNAYFLSYQNETLSSAILDDEVIVTLIAEVEISLIEERLNWYIADNFGQQKISVFQPVTPDNRENVNYFTTGPNIRVPLGVRNSFGADFRYTNITYEIRTDDNVRGSARVWLGRDLREARRVSINAFFESVEFDDPLFAQDFDRLEAFFRWDGGAGRSASGLAPAVGRNVFGFDVGYTELRVASFDDASGYVMRADWTRTMTVRSDLKMRAGSQYSDQGNIFGYYQNVSRGIGDTEDIDGDGRPFRNNFFDLTFNTTRPRSWIRWQLGWSQEDYELGFDRDRDIMWARLAFERDLSNKMFVYLGSKFDRRDYKYAFRKDDDLSFDVSLGYRLGPSITVAFQYAYYQRNSTEVAADYKEHRVNLTFTYTPAWGQMRRR